MTRCSLTFAPDGRFEVQAGPRDVDLVRSVAGLRHDHKAGVWRGPARWSTCLQLRAAFGEDLIVDPLVDAWGAEQVFKEQWMGYFKSLPTVDVCPVGPFSLLVDEVKSWREGGDVHGAL